jgi:NaMN:DMB phosphoribosyltransferase
VPGAGRLIRQGEWTGTFLGRYSDLLVLGECVPGGTTTALCVLRALGYDARVSSSFAENPVGIKEEICSQVQARIAREGVRDAIGVLRAAGDPMIAVAAGIARSYPGILLLAGGTQMLAVAAVLKAQECPLPRIVTTCYVRDDPTANFEKTAAAIGAGVTYIDPAFGDLGHAGLARYCIGEVKEGMGAGGAMFLASLLGYSPEEIRRQIFATVSAYR